MSFACYQKKHYYWQMLYIGGAFKPYPLLSAAKAFVFVCSTRLPFKSYLWNF